MTMSEFQRRSEGHALFGDLAQMRQTPDLKAARVGQDRSIPAHEIVQTAMQLDDFQIWSQPEVKSISQDDLCAQGLEFVRAHGLDHAVRADRHEHRCLDNAMFGFQHAATRFPGLMSDLKLHTE
jgi:hypothetical protein